MTRSMRFVTILMAVPGLSALGTGSAAAEAAGGDLVGFSAKLRACDFSIIKYVGTAATGSGHEIISTGAGNTVTATVNFGILRPNTPYQVRLIQGPRSAMQRCNAGDPGVASTVLHADGNGTGSVTLSAPRQSGATYAWLFVEGPPDPGQIRGEFYTSDQPTSLT
ncbi:hypothetical protein [Mycolicibacterium sp. 120270]|uniref:hypothetical protein n=1 Tax=Mycolicibacterium sp. 120270 TaxID=3090600 RepID=UPI00299CECC5|nr:hypothetical protein [Mycolicibacterium sp. 120270]MDX1885772.1 hypothetical protein [Mycolicibacterium sp. 120270]